MREEWKCGVVPRGKRCKYEPYCKLSCCRFNLSVALQELRWSLPIVGRHFRTYESKLECQEFEPMD